MLRRLLVLAAALAAAAPAHAQAWRRRLDRFLDQAPLERHLWGVAIADSTGRLLYRRNAERLFVPASNTKLTVTAAAAVLWPGDWTVRTGVYGSGPVVDGTLRGHLVLYGRGDPTMSRRCFAVDTTRADACRHDPFDPLRALARQLRGRGVGEIAGDLIGDGSWFEPDAIHPTWEWGDLPWGYAAPVSGLGFTDNSLEVTAIPTREGAPAVVTLWPDLGDATVENRTRTTPAGTPRTFTVRRAPGTLHLVAEGDVPLGAARPEYVTVPDPSLYTARAFRAALADEGIAVRGGTWATTDSLLFRELRQGAPLAEVASRPLRDWLVPILSTSQNWFAEMTLKQLGRSFGSGGSWRAGLAVVGRFLIDSVGVDSTQFALSDGSGLSTINLVSPAAFVRLLAWMRRHPGWPVFSAGLPVAGRSGTLRSRLRETPLEGRVLAKTGSLSTVNTLSGYLERPRGGPLIFSIQANHHTQGGRAMIAAIDSVLAIIGR
jgi:D-alanyl-D-alanine carboxypeptidase/D-alanyl-D-alanine-endopeptidase (penicillin-binding protein 4)